MMCLEMGAVTILHPRFENIEAYQRLSRENLTGEAPRWEFVQRRTNECTGPYQAASHEQSQAREGQPASHGRIPEMR